MSDGKTFTQADIDKVKADADARIDAMDAKVAQALDEAKEAKRKLRAASEIKPEDLQAAEDRADKLQADLAEAQKQLKAVTTERDKAVKSLEAEQDAARGYALEAELNAAIASGNVVPALGPALKAMLATSAKADLVDGKYAVSIGDKPASEHIKSFLDSDEGKAFRAAPVNGGGGAPGGGGNQGGKFITRAEYDADPVAGGNKIRDGYKLSDAA